MVNLPAVADAAERRGIRLQDVVWCPEHSYGMWTLVRIQPWWWRSRGVAGVAPATRFAAARAGERGAVAMVHEGKNGEGKQEQELTEGATRCLVGSGTR